MSWSFTGHGKPTPLLAKMKADLSKHRCSEPEETIKQQLLMTIDTALITFPESMALKIEASGSQTPQYGPDGKPTGSYTNSLSLSLTPLYGFVE